jgi:hypothetical protein
MRATDLEDLLKDRRRKSRADLALRENKLREAGLLPTGRGRSAPHIQPIHAVRIVIAAAAHVNAADCPAAVMQYMALKLVRTRHRLGHPEPEHLAAVHFAKGAATFGAALEAALSSVPLALTVRGIYLTAPVPKNKYLRDPIADITWTQNGHREERSTYVPKGSDEIVTQNYDHSQQLIRDTAVIGGDLIATIAKLLVGADASVERAGD